MPLQQTADGLQIQPVAEIVEDLVAAFKDPTDGFGDGAQVAPNSPIGQVIGIFSSKLALLQQGLQETQSRFNPLYGTGVDLDAIAGITSTTRRAADQSLSPSGVISGVNGTVVPDLARVQNVGTNEVWEVVGGPFTIAGGVAPCSFRAVDVGPKEFTVSTVWTILDPVSGWTNFFVSADIDPEDIGSLEETDEELRERRTDEFFANGNDLSAIKAQVTKVDGVEEVAVYENTDPVNTSPEGIPGGAVEVVTEGGDSEEITTAILSRKPPGTQTFGTVGNEHTTVEGTPITVYHTPVSDVDIYLDCVVTTTGAEATLPDNAVALITQAILDHGNSNSAIGQDVIPDTFLGPVFDILKDPESGKFGATGLTIRAGLSFGTVVETVTAIDLRSRADFDSLRILVAIP